MIVSRCRDIAEFKQVHSECANERIPLAEDILKIWDYVFCFYDEETKKMLGCIYLEDDNGRLCLSGFSTRKQYKKVLEAIQHVSNLVREHDLYAITDKKSAIIVLLRCGFKKIDDETYLRKAF